MGLSRAEIEEIRKKMKEKEFVNEFTFHHKNGKKETLVVTDEMALPTVLNIFQDFLSGCGYVFRQEEEILVWDHTMEPMKGVGDE